MIEVPFLVAVLVPAAGIFAMAWATIATWGAGILGRALRRERKITQAKGNVARLQQLRRQRQPKPRRSAVEDLIESKKEIRADESTRWFEAWAYASGLPNRAAVLEDVRLVETRMREAKWTPEFRARENERRRQNNRQYAGVSHVYNGDGMRVATWKGDHLTTCPAECDCPTWARRPA